MLRLNKRFNCQRSKTVYYYSDAQSRNNSPVRPRLLGLTPPQPQWVWPMLSCAQAPTRYCICDPHCHLFSSSWHLLKLRILRVLGSYTAVSRRDDSTRKGWLCDSVLLLRDICTARDLSTAYFINCQDATRHIVFSQAEQTARWWRKKKSTPTSPLCRRSSPAN